MTAPRALRRSPKLQTLRDALNALDDVFQSVFRLNTLVEAGPRIRVDTAANWTASDPILALGELSYTSDTHLLKVGDGASHWSTLPSV